jgi:hypothetical protein
MSLFGKVISDSFTSMNGDFDPARLFGYGFVLLGGLEFLGTTLYMVIKTQHFDQVGFATGLIGISGALLAAAAGVYIKKTAEVPLTPGQSPVPPGPVPMPPPIVPPMPIAPPVVGQ